MSFTARARSQRFRIFSASAIALVWLLFADPAIAAKPTAQPSFASPEQALDALIAALRAGDEKEIENVLAPGSEKLVTSGDPVSDKNERERFLAAVTEGSKLVKRGNGIFFEVGKDEWPFPIPVVMKEALALF
jgi:hypothetical protein